MAQSYLNQSRELKLTQLVDSAKKDTESLKTLVNDLNEDNRVLKLDNQNKRVKLRSNRLISIVSAAIATLLIIK